ncbi:MAG: DUF4827 domain-containing protein [Bacteroidaceae bacterium]|nr:DUF4827 domain-containing protein [Bacteroidaceae bacterium]
MKKLLMVILGLVLVGTAVTSCKDDESYADQKKKERKVVDAFLERAPVILMGANNDTLLNISKMNVITQEQFEAQDSMTDVSKNEFVFFGSTGIYMQIVRKGPGEKLQHGETKRILCRYWEYNILGDSLQTTDIAPYWATNPDVLLASNNSGTISASFDIEKGGGAMYMIYGKTAVPKGWIVPLSYINLGRQKTGDEGIALVRMIVPHSQGTEDATSNVYPCFYEISYQEF